MNGMFIPNVPATADAIAMMAVDTLMIIST